MSASARCGRGGPLDLLVVDAREMSPALLHRALRQAAEWNVSGSFRHGILVWPRPAVAGVVLAIRAGLHEIVPAGVGPLTLARVLVKAVPPGLVRQARLRRLWSLLRLGRGGAPARSGTPEGDLAAHLADEQREQFERELAEREATLAQREQELRATAARVQSDLSRANQACAMIELAAEMRAELEKREDELRLLARQVSEPEAVEPEARLHREMEALLDTQRRSLDQRERALATRERWLSDYEQALTGRAANTDAN